MLALRGPNAKRASLDLFNSSNMIRVPSTSEQPIQLRSVVQYKHMGSIFTGVGCSAEIQHRVHNATLAHKVLRKYALRQPSLSKETKCSLVSSLVLSRLFYNACLWGRLSNSDLRKLRGLYMRMYREIHGMTNYEAERHTSDLAVLDHAQIFEVSDYVSILRLKYLKRLLNSDQHVLHGLLGCASIREGSWLHAVCDDFARMRSIACNSFANLPDPHVDVCPWLELVRTLPSWPSFVYKTFRKSLVGRMQATDNHNDAASLGQPLELSFCCYECGAQFNCQADVLNHAHRSHGYKTPSRFFNVNNQCLACLTIFADRGKVVAHHQWGGKECLQLLQQMYTPLSLQHVQRLDDAALKSKSVRSSTRGPPARRAYGPRVSPHILVDGQLRPLVQSQEIVLLEASQA